MWSHTLRWGKPGLLTSGLGPAVGSDPGWPGYGPALPSSSGAFCRHLTSLGRGSPSIVSGHPHQSEGTPHENHSRRQGKNREHPTDSGIGSGSAVGNSYLKRVVGLIPGSGRSPGGGHGHPLQYSCLGNPTDRGTWLAATHGGAKEVDMT